MYLSIKIATSLLLLFTAASCCCTQKLKDCNTMKKHFFELPDNKSASLYSLRLKDGFGADITDFGGCIVSLYTHDKHGKLRDVVLGWKEPEKYLKNPAYLGALVGRVPNRISNGRFTLDNTVYQMVLNDRRGSTLHGGYSFAHRLWQVTKHTPTELELYLKSPHGDAGFPGEIEIKAKYSLLKNHTLEFSFEITSDRTTVADLTNHAYFNLDGDNGGECGGHFIQVKADRITEINKIGQPTGKTPDVAGTYFDLRKGKLLSEAFAAGNGYDHNFILGGKNNVYRENAAVVYSQKSGIKLIMHTDRPGVQIYTGGVRGEGKNGQYVPRGSFCLETQNWPDAVNNKNFPSIRLEKGEVMRGVTRYQFTH